MSRVAPPLGLLLLSDAMRCLDFVGMAGSLAESRHPGFECVQPALMLSQQLRAKGLHVGIAQQLDQAVRPLDVVDMKIWATASAALFAPSLMAPPPGAFENADYRPFRRRGARRCIATIEDGRIRWTLSQYANKQH
jgi:hypothetical protein